MRSSDVNGNEIECILSHEADKIETRNLKTLNPQKESQLKNNPFYRLSPFVSSFRSGNEFSFTQVRDDFKLGRWMSFYSFLSHGSESRSHFPTNCRVCSF
ncbi:unnamed protein product [Brassica rapa subsp. trilocularis]